MDIQQKAVLQKCIPELCQSMDVDGVKSLKK
jgi:hypothetical protein